MLGVGASLAPNPARAYIPCLLHMWLTSLQSHTALHGRRSCLLLRFCLTWAHALLYRRVTKTQLCMQVPDKGGSPVVVCPWSDTAATLLSYAQVSFSASNAV